MFLLISEGLLGAAIGFILGAGFKKAGFIKKILAVSHLFLVTIINIFLVLKIFSNGTASHLVKYQVNVPAHLENLDAPDPSLPGHYPFRELTYGSGTDSKRPDYGKEVDIKTGMVDASVILNGYQGYKARLRNWYWGFDVKAFPVNGRVWYPEGQGPFPLVLIVHGNHNMYDYLDAGYAYLGVLLASRGFITVSVDENFLNTGFINEIPCRESENAARGWLLLQHLNTWKSFNQTRGNIFFGKVDMDKIALVGRAIPTLPKKSAPGKCKLLHPPWQS